MSIRIEEEIVKRRCQGVKADGERCRNAILEWEKYCHSHHPDYAEERSRNSKRAANTAKMNKVPQELRQVRGIQKAALSLSDRYRERKVDRKTLHYSLALLNTQLRALELEHGLIRHSPAKSHRINRLAELGRELERDLAEVETSENGR